MVDTIKMVQFCLLAVRALIKFKAMASDLILCINDLPLFSLFRTRSRSSSCIDWRRHHRHRQSCQPKCHHPGRLHWRRLAPLFSGFSFLLMKPTGETSRNNPIVFSSPSCFVTWLMNTQSPYWISCVYTGPLTYLSWRCLMVYSCSEGNQYLLTFIAQLWAS